VHLDRPAADGIIRACPRQSKTGPGETPWCRPAVVHLVRAAHPVCWPSQWTAKPSPEGSNAMLHRGQRRTASLHGADHFRRFRSGQTLPRCGPESGPRVGTGSPRWVLALFPPRSARIISHPTHATSKSLHYSLRKNQEPRPNFPNDDARKSNCCGYPIRDIEDNSPRLREQRTPGKRSEAVCCPGRWSEA